MKPWEYIKNIREGWECFCGGIFIHKYEDKLVCNKCGLIIILESGEQ